MKKTGAIIMILVTIMTLSSFTNVTDEDLLSQGITAQELEQMKEDKIEGKTGKKTFSECHASISIPEGFVFIDKTDARKLLVDYWGNPESHIENLLGCLVPNNAEAFYQVSMAYVITYDNCGYVKDDDANSVDYDELLSQIQQASIEENKNLPKEQQTTIRGWAVQPKYISDSHVLVWAKTLSINGVETVNYDMRILGKDGLVSINAVIDPNDCSEVVKEETNIINCLSYDKGYTYADFDSSRDKTSEWTIGGLVAGTVLAKSGILAKIGIFLLKFWKIIALGVAGAFAGIVKFFKKNKNE